MPGQFHTKMNKKKILLTKKISKKIFKQALKIKSMNEKSKIKNIEKTLDVLINDNSKLKVSGKIISSQYDNLNKLKLKNKDLFTYIRKN